MSQRTQPFAFHLGFNSPFFSTVVLFKNQLFPRVFDGFLKRRIPGKNGEASLDQFPFKPTNQKQYLDGR